MWPRQPCPSSLSRGRSQGLDHQDARTRNLKTEYGRWTMDDGKMQDTLQHSIGDFDWHHRDSVSCLLRPTTSISFSHGGRATAISAIGHTVSDTVPTLKAPLPPANQMPISHLPRPSRPFPILPISIIIIRIEPILNSSSEHE